MTLTRRVLPALLVVFPALAAHAQATAPRPRVVFVTKGVVVYKNVIQERR